MPTLSYDDHCTEITRQTEQLGRLLLSGADLAARVPTCPAWSLEELVRHTGGAMRWAELLVRTRARADVDDSEVPGIDGPDGWGDPAALEAWLTNSAAAVVGALRKAGPDAAVWTWTDARTADFWARRMVHEVLVHRADAALAVGAPFEVAAEVACDAIDEWLDLVRSVQRRRPRDLGGWDLADGRSLHLHATDTAAEVDAEWLIEAAEGGFAWRRGHEKATAALRGPLTSVLLAFYRRLPPEAPGLEVLGERAVLDSWLATAAF
ncbi:maleylpyruvate isomerase family mycothiol-dependent enzyme [Streptomyces sp. NPDC003717]|uniref:maleylpyruvate isomerase family mycothiol-dependent enzyme n=1 Tax=Streptomyces sp. NPDC003717 TaxID=3154276 RepID=UPI0033A01BE6